MEIVIFREERLHAINGHRWLFLFPCPLFFSPITVQL
jgi:hypothetical protein